MFCYQCEQTANGTGCTKIGVCARNLMWLRFKMFSFTRCRVFLRWLWKDGKWE